MNEIVASLIRTASQTVQRCWPAMLIGAIWLWMFWPMMSGQTVVGFRDSAYFYYPWFQWINRQWESGQIPLWNPYCDLGHPVVADGTSSVFYPGKLVFLLGFLNYPSRYGIYIAMHVLLAAAGSYYFARRLGAGSIGATLAAFSYSFGGSVLFQTTNVVYLVSASLLPFALANVWTMFRRRQWRNAVAVGVVCALMILGGDPQMAYLVGLMAVGMLLGKAVHFSRHVRSGSRMREQLQLTRFFGFGCRQLAIFAAVMFALSAVQILPSYTWARQSVRASRDSADSISSRALKAIQKIEPGSVADSIYQFSQPPWSILEMLWPNFYGKLYPMDQHWGSKLPGADRTWTPSLYVGLLTILFGLSAMRLKRGNRRCVWLTKVIVFFVTASFGWYGLVWLWNEVVGNIGLSGVPGIGEPVGGIYWMMVTLLPEFHLFRYPAKLFVVASLGLCVLAGLGLSSSRPRTVTPIWCVTFFLMTLLAILFWPFTAVVDSRWLQSNPTWFGPFDFQGARAVLLHTLMHALIVSALFFLVMFVNRRQTDSGGSIGLDKRHAVLLLIAVADVWVANYWLVPQVDRQVLESGTDVEIRLADLHSDNLNSDVSVVRNPIPPARLFETCSENRLEEIIAWQRESMHPKHNLSIPIGVIGSFSSIEHPANTAFANDVRSQLGELDSARSDGLRLLPRMVLVSKEQLAGFESGEVNVFSLLTKKQSASHDHEYRLKRISNHQIELSVSASKPGGVLFSSLPCPGWKIHVSNALTGEEIGEHQIDGGDFFLAARLPAGEIRVVFEYSPIEFWIGLWITLMAWPLLMLACLRNCRLFLGVCD